MKTKGFTLIELLVVISIIGVLATIVLGSLSSARERARDAKRQADMRSIQTALEVYYLDNGQYPGTGSNTFYYSNDYGTGSADWSLFEDALGVTLPRDPVNEDGQPTSTAIGNTGVLAYTYMSFNSPTFGCGNRQTYMLVYISEGGIEGQGGGGTTCHTPPREYNETFNSGNRQNANVYSAPN